MAELRVEQWTRKLIHAAASVLSAESKQIGEREKELAAVLRCSLQGLGKSMGEWSSFQRTIHRYLYGKGVNKGRLLEAVARADARLKKTQAGAGQV